MDLPDNDGALTRRRLMTAAGKMLAIFAMPLRLQESGPRRSAPARTSQAITSSAIMDRLSAYMAAAGEQPLPAVIVDKTKQHLLDTLAAMISGTELIPGRVALRFARLFSGSSAAMIVGSSLLCGPLEAAVTNGMLAHADETDDSHASSHSHPGCAIIPAVLVAGEQFSISGERFLRAIALGYDIGTRVLMSMGGLDFQVQTHHDAHSMANTFGASAAAACCASLNARQMRWLLDYAAQQDSGIAAWQRDRQHIEKAFVFAGGPARNGVTATLLIHAGATGINDIFSGPDNFFQAFQPHADPAGLIDQLGVRFEIARTNIKKWSVGSPIQAPLDALQIIRKKHLFRTDQVKSVVVRLATHKASTVNNRAMPNISLQQMVAVMLVKGTVTFKDAHDYALMQDLSILRERAKIELVPDSQLQKLYPQLVGIVEVTLKDGQHWSQRVDHVRGTVGNPMTNEEVMAKARDLIEPRLGSAQTSLLIKTIFEIEKVKNIGSLRSLLQPQSGLEGA